MTEEERRQQLLAQIPGQSVAAPPALNQPPGIIDNALGSGAAQSAMAIPAVGGVTAALRSLRAANIAARTATVGKTSADIVRESAQLGVPAAAAATRSLRAPALAAGGAAAVGGGGMYLGGAPAAAAPDPSQAFLDSPAQAAVVGGTSAVPPMANPAAVIPGSAPVAASSTTSADRIAQMNRDGQHLQAMTDIQRRIDASGGGGGMTSGPGLVAIGNPGPDAAARFFEQANLRNAAGKTVMTRRGAVPDEAALKAAMVPIEQRAEAEKLGAQAQSDQARITSGERIASLRDATDRRGQDVQAEGNQINSESNAARVAATLRGQNITSDTERAKLINEQMNKDRQFNLDRAKLGTATAETEYKARMEANEALPKRIATFLPPGPDGKPDAVGAARAAEAVQAALVADTQRLEAAVAADPNNKDAAAALDKLNREGPKAYSEQRVRQLVEGHRAREIAVANNSFMGGRLGIGGRGVQSAEPITSMRKEKRTFGDVYVAPDGSVIPAEEIEGSRGTFGFGARPSQNFRNITR